MGAYVASYRESPESMMRAEIGQLLQRKHWIEDSVVEGDIRPLHSICSNRTLSKQHSLNLL